MENIKMHRKLFVGGVSRDTSEATLRKYFAQFGEVDDCVIIFDRSTGFSKGFGFVCFTHPSMAQLALSQPHHAILGKKVDVKPARPRGQMELSQEYDTTDPARVKKIFVGGLPDGLTVREFRTYFESYGSIQDAVVMHDGDGKPRGFGFVTFESEDAAMDVLQERFHELGDKMVEVKRAEPRERLVYGLVETYDSYNTGLACEQNLKSWGGYGSCVCYPVLHPFYSYGYNVYVDQRYWYPQVSNPRHCARSSSETRSINVENPIGANSSVESLNENDSKATAHDLIAGEAKPNREMELSESNEGNQTETDENVSVENASAESTSTCCDGDENDIAPVDENGTSNFSSPNLKTMIDSTMRKMLMIRPMSR